MLFKSKRIRQGTVAVHMNMFAKKNLDPQLSLSTFGVYLIIVLTQWEVGQ